MTGALAGVIAALVIVPAAIKYFKERHRPYVGHLTVSTFATQVVDGRTYHLAEMSNGGGAAVQIVLFGFVHSRGAWDKVQERSKWWLGVGESMTVPFEVDDDQRAWLLVMYVGQDDLRWARSTWMPLFRNSEADEQWREAWEKWKPARWWLPWRSLWRPRVQPVGPGGAWASKVKSGAKSDALETVTKTFHDHGGTTYMRGMAASPKR
jgi:hypothetical protein